MFYYKDSWRKIQTTGETNSYFVSVFSLYFVQFRRALCWEMSGYISTRLLHYITTIYFNWHYLDGSLCAVLFAVYL